MLGTGGCIMTVCKGVVIVSQAKSRASQVPGAPVYVRRNEKRHEKLRCQNKAGNIKRGAGRGDARVKVRKLRNEMKEREPPGHGEGNEERKIY
jgi:hypothetical protein